MSDGLQVTDEVKKSRTGLIGALVALALVAGGTGAMYLNEIGPFAPAETEAVEAAPAEPEESTEQTLTPVVTAATVPLPPADAQEAMYWEQVASASTIADLVNNKFASFALSQIATNDDKADIRVVGTYREGGTYGGWLLLKQYEGAWYFAMITADPNDLVTPDLGDPDADVMKAIVEQQAANQDVYRDILAGTYDTITITRVTKGSGTAMADIELSKGTGTPVKAQISLISKDGGTGTQWFITAFTR
ncbi:MAG: hypothetical protein U1E29_17330 [Coriobacteriia bacterium]|nr:hypothetical protein [Coriobacteriia bacterium]